jgi:hypothetical protein
MSSRLNHDILLKMIERMENPEGFKMDLKTATQRGVALSGQTIAEIPHHIALACRILGHNLDTILIERYRSEETLTLYPTNSGNKCSRCGQVFLYGKPYPPRKEEKL